MLEIKDIRVAYGSHLVLDGLNISMEKGTIHGILGMNGAGKTTLFRTIYGFLQPQKGRILFDGEKMSKKTIGFLETSPFFYSYMKGREYLNLLARQTEDFDIEGWNRIFELPLETYVEEYSTGMKKKLAFIGILALNRPILILDEPFNGVDIESNEKLTQIILKIKQSNKIIIVSSHILSTLTHISDRISVLQDKQILKTYEKDSFPILEKELSKMVKNKIDDTLDELLKQN